MPDEILNDESIAPLYVELGDILKEQEVEGSRYTFENISFLSMGVGTYPSEGGEELTLDSANSMLYFKTTYDAIAGTSDSKNDWFGSISDSEVIFKEEGFNEDLVYADSELEKNSGFVTPVGTVIPAIIYAENFGRNTLSFKEDEEKSDISTYASTSTIEDWTYNWEAEKLAEGEDDNEKTVIAKNDLSKYGNVYTVAKDVSYISMYGKTPLLHREGEGFIQKFSTDLPQAGAIAILCDFNESYELNSDKEKEQGRNVKFKFYSEDSEADVIELTLAPGTNVKVEINDNGGIEGPLTYSGEGLQITHTKSDALKNKSVIFLYPLTNHLIVTGDLVTDPEQTNKSLICKKYKELDIMGDTTPPVNEFPAKHKNGGSNCIVLESKKSYITLGNKCQCTWTNCSGNFAISALRFAPSMRFTYFYRLSGTETADVDGLSIDEDYFMLEVGRQNYGYTFSGDGGYSTLPGKFYASLVSTDDETQTSVYRVDFECNSSNTYLQTYPAELFGLIHVTKRTGKLADVLAGNGDFDADFKDQQDTSMYTNYVNSGSSNMEFESGWERFITQVSVSHGIDGSSGSLTLDKYLMMDLNAIPEQVIGAITLVAKNGFYNSDNTTMNGVEYHFNPNSSYYDITDGLIFKGYGMEIQDSISESSSQLNVKLVGIQKKLSDMKLVNCPFWDGDQVFENGENGVLNYFISYTGCDLRYVPAFSSGTVSGIILPRSWDWRSPAVNFVLGTSCLDALNDIAKKINHQFVIQPDGCGYFYAMDDYGCPLWVKNGPIVATLEDTDIISKEISPYLENRYNTFLTMGVLANRDNRTGSLFPAGEEPGMKFTQIAISRGDYPWSRIYTEAEPGILTINDLETFHEINVKFGTSEIYQGSVTVPGWHGYYIFDKINLAGTTYYITNVSHSISMQSKEWTTSLSIARFDVDD